MSWRAACIGAAGWWAIAASAQTLPRLIIKPGSPIEYKKTGHELFDLMKGPDTSAVCSIPLLEVPVAKSAMRVDRMPVLRPSKRVEPMPLVPLPAPPCKEDKR